MAKAKEKVTKYDVPALVITPDKPTLAEGNFTDVENELKKWSLAVSKMALTEDNLDEVQLIKKAAVAVRNQIKAKVEAAKKLLFNDPKSIFEARMEALFKLVATVETKADEVLVKIEDERKDGINEVLDDYKAKFQETYKLADEYLELIEYKKNYYNKGMDEKSRKDDLEQQFKDQKKAQDAYAANVRLITVSCKGEPRLNVDRYIRDLAVSDVATIVEEIQKEKDRLKELDNPQQTTSTTTAIEVDAEVVETATSEETKKLVLGVPSTISWLSDFPGRKTSMKIEISYPCDLGDSLKELFEGLKPHGIKIKRIKQEEVAF